MWIIWMILTGLVVGAIAKVIMPGKDPGGIIITILLGIAGAILGSWLGRLLGFNPNTGLLASLIWSVIGAVIILGIYRLVAGRRAVSR
ncbi:MAG: GlsB/YeaQ/YmgE family stress response membrane protein [Pseudonocardiaceae bacterium]